MSPALQGGETRRKLGMWCTPCNIATRRCPCMGAMPSSASRVPASPDWNNRSAVRCAGAQFCVVGSGAAIRISRRAASFRSVSCGGVQGSRRVRTSRPVARDDERKLPGDDELTFWAPIHKLFSGPECIAGLNLQVGLERGLRNDELAQLRRYLDHAGLKNNWSARTWNNSRSRSRTSSSDRCRRGPTLAMACSNRVRLRW